MFHRLCQSCPSLFHRTIHSCKLCQGHCGVCMWASIWLDSIHCCDVVDRTHFLNIFIAVLLDQCIFLSCFMHLCAF